MTPAQHVDSKTQASAARAARQSEKDTLREVAKIRQARTRAQEGGGRQRLVVTLDRAPGVTAAGGRNLYRRYDGFEGIALPIGHTGRRQETSGLAASLVFRIKARSLGGEGGSRWRRREAARFGRYLIRPAALEASPADCIITNIVGEDVARGSDAFVRDLVAFLIAVEETEQAIDPNGQVYKSIIIPLPHDVGPEGRQRICRTLTEPLRDRDMPFLAVLHAPDRRGDQRNHHLHVMVVTRACHPIGTRRWSFAETKSRDLFHPAMLRVWRRATVATFNRELAIAGAERRYTLVGADTTERHRGRVGTDRDRRRVAEADARFAAAKAALTRVEALAMVARRAAALAQRMLHLAGTMERLRLRLLKARCEKLRDRVAMQAMAVRHMIERTRHRDQLRIVQDETRRMARRIATASMLLRRRRQELLAGRADRLRARLNAAIGAIGIARDATLTLAPIAATTAASAIDRTALLRDELMRRRAKDPAVRRDVAVVTTIGHRQEPLDSDPPPGPLSADPMGMAEIALLADIAQHRQSNVWDARDFDGRSHFLAAVKAPGSPHSHVDRNSLQPPDDIASTWERDQAFWAARTTTRSR